MSKSLTFEAVVLCYLFQLRVFSFVTGAPFGVKDEAVFVDATLLKRLLWTANLGVVWVRALFVAGAIGLSLSVDRFWNPFFLPLYLFFFAGCFPVIIGYSVFSCESGCFAAIWNFLLRQKATVQPPKLLVWFMLVFIPSAYVSNLAVSALLVLNPQLVIQFRFAVEWALEEGFLTAGTIYYALVTISTVADVWSFFIIGSLGFSVAIFHMLFLETWTSVMKGLLDSCKTRGRSDEVEVVWRELRVLAAAIRIFNTGNSTAIFVFKLLLLIMSISSLTSLLLLDFSDHLLFLGIMSYTSFAAGVAFPALYHRAYGVSTGLLRAKRELLKLNKLDRRLGVILPEGVQVGGFRTFERESDLIYMDFIVKQITSIVLAWE